MVIYAIFFTVDSTYKIVVSVKSTASSNYDAYLSHLGLLADT